MGKHLQRQQSGVEFEEYQPGCLGGIVHILDYQHRNNDKKMKQQKKHRRRRRGICCLNSKTISMDRDNGEVQSLLVAEADNILVEQQAAQKSPINKSSGKPHINTLFGKEISTGENHKHWLLGFPAQPRLQRMDSIHNLEPSDNRLGKMDWTNQIIVLRKSADTCDTGLQISSQKKRTRKHAAKNKKSETCDTMTMEDSLGQNQVSGKESSKNQKQMDAKHLSREISGHQVKEYLDVLELFKVDKELFLNILEDPEVLISKRVNGLQMSNSKAKLTKSVSFPVADRSHVRYLRPTTIEHKRNESWTLRKGEKLLSSIQVPKLDVDPSQKGYDERKVPPAGDENVGITEKHKTITASQGSIQGSHHQWWNHLFIGRLRDIKQRIKHAIKESKKESNRIYMDGVVDGYAGSTNAKEMPTSLENTSMDQDGVETSDSFYKVDGSGNNLSDSSSLNESINRYVQLFGSNFSGEAKLHHSKSLKLRNEDRISSRERAPKFFRRISSLSEVESFYSLLNEVVHDPEMQVRTEVDCSTNTESDNEFQTKSSSFQVDSNKCEPSEVAVETEFQENMAQESDSLVGTEYSGSLMVARIDKEIDRAGKLGGNIIDPATVASIPQEDQEIGSTTTLNLDLEQPSVVSEPETCFPDNTADQTECPISEGLDSNTISIHINEAASSFDIQNMYGTYSLPGFLEKANHKDYNFLHFEMDIDDASFNYVRDVLELSGFIENESLGAWFSLDQPLDPSLFKELEKYLHNELQCYPEEFVGNCDHQLLFDLINETLLEIYERSFTYFPRAFSFNNHTRPMPKGHHVLENVWARICSYMSFRSELDHSLDDIVAQDLAKRDGWMSHQFETECVALELEDLIFDELLNEVISSAR